MPDGWCADTAVGNVFIQPGPVTRLPKALKTLDDALDQREHWPTALASVKEVHDRILGPVKGKTGEGSNEPRISVSIGIFSHPNLQNQARIVDIPVDGEVLDEDEGDD